MKPVVVIILSSTLVVFLTMQLIQPEFNSTTVITDGDISHSMQVPQPVWDTMKASCYDCHSHNAVWPWYSRIAPVSWLMDYDIRNGRAALNFSQWNEIDASQQAMTLQLMCRQVESGEMPLKKYLLMHPKARMSDAETTAFCDWTRQQASMLEGGSGK